MTPKTFARFLMVFGVLLVSFGMVLSAQAQTLPTASGSLAVSNFIQATGTATAAATGSPAATAAATGSPAATGTTAAPAATTTTAAPAATAAATGTATGPATLPTTGGESTFSPSLGIMTLILAGVFTLILGLGIQRRNER